MSVGLITKYKHNSSKFQWEQLKLVKPL